MKNNKNLTILKLLFLLFVVNNVNAQADLTGIDLTYTPVAGAFDIFLTVTNNSASPSGPITLFFEYEQSDFIDNGNGDPAPFSCSHGFYAATGTNGMICDLAGGLNAGDINSMSLGLDVVTANTVNVPMAISVYDGNGLVLSSSSTTIILAVGVATLDLVDQPDPTPVTEGVETSTAVDFQITNTSMTAGDKTQIVLSVNYDDINFTFDDIATAAGLPASWFCSGNISPVVCTFGGAGTILQNEHIDFPLQFLINQSPSPAPSGLYSFDGTLNFLGAAVDTQTESLIIDPFLLAPVTVNKSLVNGNNGAFLVGETVIYNILVENTSGNDLVDLVIKDVLDVGFLDASTISFNILQAPINSLCLYDSISKVTCTNSNGSALNSGDFFEIEIQAEALAIGTNISNIATASSNAFAFNIDSSAVLIDIGANTPMVTPTSISVEKYALVNGDRVSSVAKGASFVYEVIVFNTGNGALSSMSIIDTMPDGVVVDSIDAPTGMFCTNIGQAYDCSFHGGVPIASSISVAFNVTDNSPEQATELLNTVVVTAINATAKSTENSIQLTNSALTLNVTQSPSPILPGVTFDLIIDINNTGSEDFMGISIVNTLPDGFSYVSQNNAGACQIPIGQVITCDFDVISSNSIQSVVVAVTSDINIDLNSVFNNETVASSASVPLITSQNITLNIEGSSTGGQHSFQIELNDDVDPVNQGMNFNYTATLKNTGSLPLQFVHVDFEIPSELTINSVVSNVMNCIPAANGINCENAEGAVAGSSALSINPGEQMDIVVINAKVNNFVGELMTRAVAFSDNVLDVVDIETTIFIEDVVSKADLAISIMNQSVATQGSTTSFDLKVTNNGDGVADKPTVDVSVTGLIDQVTVAANSVWDCQVNGTAVHCDFEANEMSNGHMSTISITTNLAQVSIDAENIGITATVASTTEDLVPSNNLVMAEIDVNGTPTEGEILSALQAAVSGIANTQTVQAIQNVASYCGRDFFMALEGLCDDLYQTALNGEGETVNNVMEQITPSEVIGQSSSIAELANAQFRNINSRLLQLRGGTGGGFNLSGLNATYGNGSIPLGMLAYLNKATDEVTDINNDFISPWGFFVNGTISMGERDATGRELGFDFDSYGLTAGLDYRLDAKKVLGIALGYANFDSKIDGQAKLSSTGITLTGYGSFYINDNFYVDARISAARPDFDQRRNINFTLGDTTIDRVAIGETNANQYSFAMSAGYSFYKNSWNITPNASIRYVNTSIDKFRETGAGDFNFEYSDQELESMVWSAGLRISKAISLKNGVITPQFDFDYNYESLNDGNDIEARFIMAPDDEIFIIETDSPDRSYGSAGIGFVYITANGKQAYFNYRSILGLEGFSRGTFNIGARFEF